MGAKSAKEAGTILAPMLIFITIQALLTSVINLEGLNLSGLLYLFSTYCWQ